MRLSQVVRLISFLFVISCLFPGCFALEFGFEAEAVGLAEADVAAAAAIGGEEAMLLRSAIAIDAEGELILANTEAANTLLGRIRLVRSSGVARLVSEKTGNAFASVNAETGSIRMLRSGKVYSAPENLFAVKGDRVLVRSAAVENGRVVSTLRQDHLVIKLAERNNWYQIKFVEGGRPHYGWIPAAAALALVTHDRKNSTAHNYQVHDEYVARVDTIENIAPLQGKWRTDGIPSISPTQGIYNSTGIQDISPTGGNYNTGIPSISPTQGVYNNGAPFISPTEGKYRDEGIKNINPTKGQYNTSNSTESSSVTTSGRGRTVTTVSTRTTVETIRKEMTITTRGDGTRDTVFKTERSINGVPEKKNADTVKSFTRPVQMTNGAVQMSSPVRNPWRQ
ncbi:MAG: SH3 domain-containing protein [Bacteroidota bacterium]